MHKEKSQTICLFSRAQRRSVEKCVRRRSIFLLRPVRPFASHFLRVSFTSSCDITLYRRYSALCAERMCMVFDLWPFFGWAARSTDDVDIRARLELHPRVTPEAIVLQIAVTLLIISAHFFTLLFFLFTEKLIFLIINLCLENISQVRNIIKTTLIPYLRSWLQLLSIVR